MRESADLHIDAPPAAVLARLTDIAGLADWNDAIVAVLEQPPQLDVGAQWTVRMRALGQTWVSRSTLVELDEDAGRFRHRSDTDDGNPSHADWEWIVLPDGDGARVSVTAELHPETFWRRYLLVHLRRPVLRREMQASLRNLASSVSA